MRDIDRRRFLACLFAALAASAAPSIAGPLRRKQRFTLQRRFIPPGSEVTALADGADRIIYGVRTLITAVCRIADDCFVWTVEYDGADDPFHIGDVVCGRISVVEAAIPDDIVAWAHNRWQTRDLPWQQEIVEVGPDNARPLRSFLARLAERTQSVVSVEHIRYLCDAPLHEITVVASDDPNVQRLIERKTTRWRKSEEWRHEG